MRYPLAELRAAAHSSDYTINDFLIAAVTAGLRELLIGRGPPGLQLRASVPVGARGGLQGGMFMAPLPVGVDDPAERLQVITQTTAARKQHPDEGVADIVAMPASLARIGVAWARRAAGSHINLYITNVPGPPQPLYLAAARLLQATLPAPLVAGVRLSVTAISYDGQFAVSLLADEHLPKLPKLAKAIRTTFDRYLSRTA